MAPEEFAPGPAADNEEALREFMQATTTSYYHPAGTCAIGESGEAVVDSELRVHGISGLRVSRCVGHAVAAVQQPVGHRVRHRRARRRADPKPVSTMDSAATVFARLVDAEPSGARELFDTACVLGGSVAGLLAARVLSDYARQVVIVERDVVTETTLARQGVPHGQQLHVLLPAGRQWMDRWLPGWTDELLDRGAIMSSSRSRPRDL